jgi:hypothetical protein
MEKSDFLKDPVKNTDIKSFDSTPIIEAMNSFKSATTTTNRWCMRKPPVSCPSLSATSIIFGTGKRDIKDNGTKYLVLPHDIGKEKTRYQS